MNNIKPRWVIAGVVVVGALWLTETANRPEPIQNRALQPDHLVNREHRAATMPREPFPQSKIDPLSVVDQQVAENKVVQPLTARMLVGNRGEFFAIQSAALPAQERVLLVDMGYQEAQPSNGVDEKTPCQFKSCLGQDASDY